MSERNEALFTDAADVIDERGWAQGAYESEDGGLCFTAALTMAAYKQLFGAFPEYYRLVDSLIDDEEQNAEIKALLEGLSPTLLLLFKEEIPAPLSSAPEILNPLAVAVGWNDYQRRKQQEVLDRLRKGAKIEAGVIE